MIIYSNTLQVSDLNRICDSMGITLYDHDYDFSGARRRRFKTTIRPQHGEAGERWRKIVNGRRLFACSWDAHYVFMSVVLELDHDAEFKSALAHWKGREDFHDRAPATGENNWGSLMYPVMARDQSHSPMSFQDMRTLACELAGAEPAFKAQDGHVVTMTYSTIVKCPHVIFNAEHYRSDGTCKCNDPAENIMAEWGYTWDEVKSQWT